MAQIKRLCLIVMLFVTMAAQAQFEKKFNTHAYLAVPLMKTSEGVPSETVLDGYGKAPYIGVGINYAFNTKFSVQADLRFLYATKLENVYSISHTNIDWMLKYNVLHNDKPISPYVTLGFNTGTLYLVQKENAEEDTNFETSETGEVEHVKIEKRNPEIKFTMFPAIGFVGGAGIDFTFKKSIGINIGVLYQTSTIQNHVLLEEFFPDNVSNFNFLMLQAGIKFSFLQSKKL